MFKLNYNTMSVNVYYHIIFIHYLISHNLESELSKKIFIKAEKVKI